MLLRSNESNGARVDLFSQADVPVSCDHRVVDLAVLSGETTFDHAARKPHAGLIEEVFRPECTIPFLDLETSPPETVRIRSPLFSRITYRVSSFITSLPCQSSITLASSLTASQAARRISGRLWELL